MRNRSDSAAHQGILGIAERLPRELAARAVGICDLHAARVVDQDPEHVLLRNRCLHDENRSEDAEQQQRERAQPQGRKHGPLSPPHAVLQHAVADERHREAGNHDGRGKRGPCRRRKPEVSLVEDDGAVLEKELKQRLEHEGSADAEVDCTSLRRRGWAVGSPGGRTRHVGRGFRPAGVNTGLLASAKATAVRRSAFARRRKTRPTRVAIVSAGLSRPSRKRAQRSRSRVRRTPSTPHPRPPRADRGDRAGRPRSAECP